MKTGPNPAETILEKLITFRNEIFKNFRPKAEVFLLNLSTEFNSWLDLIYNRIASKAINTRSFIFKLPGMKQTQVSCWQ